MAQVETFGIQETSDEIICQAEVDLYKKSIKNKSQIILAAAVKLEKSEKYEKHQIANRIVILFPDWSRSTIYAALDDSYKREYNTDDDNDDDAETAEHVTTLLEEIFLHVIDTSENLKKFAKTIIKRSTESPELGKELSDTLDEAIHTMHNECYLDTLKDEMSKIGQLAEFAEFVKKLAFDSQLLADKIDSRQKIDMAMKLGLKLRLIQHLPRNLAKKLKMSPKWISQIDNDPKILDFINTIPHCPVCTFNFTDYINACELAEKKQIPKPDPHDFVSAK